MIIFGVTLSMAGVGFFCWLLFTLAVYALPFFVGLTAGLAAYHGGAGVIGAIITTVLVGGAVLAIGQTVFTAVRMPMVRAAIGLLYAGPAAFADYHATLGLAHVGISSEGWRQAFALVGAVLIGATAWVRMSAFTPAPMNGKGVAAGPTQSPDALGLRDQASV